MAKPSYSTHPPATTALSRLLEPEELARHLDDPNLLLVDLCSDTLYASAHIPGAVHVAPRELLSGEPPATGRLPSVKILNALFSRLGLAPDSHVVAYDDEGGGWAGRLLWTLDVIGHHDWSYLNGGMIAWRNEGFPTTSAIPEPKPIQFRCTLHPEPIAEAADILANLGREDFAVWDARSQEEYDGVRVLAQKGGHIPGAIHCEWTTLMDRSRNLRLRGDAREVLKSLGLTPDKNIITHCQSHHRSAFTWLVGRLLEYPRIKGYHGSWSEWGNLPDTPTET